MSGNNPAVLLVTGGRSFRDRLALFARLADLRSRFASRGVVVWSGGAAGADQLAVAWARSVGVPSRSFPADWSLGASAGPRRNQRMVSAASSRGVPVVCVACPGGPGTASCVRLAQAAGFPVSRVAGGPVLPPSQLSLF